MAARHPQALNSNTMTTLAPFTNEPFKDFTNADVRRQMQAALVAVQNDLGEEYSLVIGGLRVQTTAKIRSTNPARPAQLVGLHQAAGPEHAQPAMDAAQKAFATWSRTSVEARVDLLLRASSLIKARHFEFCAWLTFEVGKNWAEADADVGECIDFLEFYAREALRLAGSTTPIQFPGERNQLVYIPLGVGAVIPPWNFPFAIMAGMTAAAIVTGNTVILKPSVDAPTVAAKFFALLEQAGLPDGVVNFCPGEGPGFGAAVVAHPQTRFIAFTGSKKVGLEIHEAAAKTQPGQRWIKRTILEMGGKDSIIVDRDCDLDSAVEGVVQSAFGFSGQKCSACSRAIVDATIYDVFVDRLEERVSQIKQGDPAENFYAGPVISPIAYKRVLDYIAIGESEARLLTGGDPVEIEGGYYIAARRLRRRASHIPHCTRRNLRPRPGRHKSRELRASSHHRQQHRVRTHRSHLQQHSREVRPGPPGIPRRQLIPEPQMHRSHGRRTPLRRLQHVRHRLESRRSRLLVTLHPGKVHSRESKSRKQASRRRRIPHGNLITKYNADKTDKHRIRTDALSALIL